MLTVAKPAQACQVTRPGGGGESDAAFTPSPPVSLSLAHQTRIRSLYSMSDHKILRPDSSSSASSATDWESSGHATVVRRQPMPPLPPPRLQPVASNLSNSGPLVDNMLPLSQVYNNLTLVDRDSSDSDFEKVQQATTMLVHRRFKPSPLHKASKSTEIVDITPAEPSGFSKYYPKEATQVVKVQPKVMPEDDSMMTSQLRNMTRELTPTISDVYHERNIGLGLAPPLAKLLLNQTSSNDLATGLDKLSNLDCEQPLEQPPQPLTAPPSKKETANKPWLPGTNAVAPSIQNSDLSTADILVREAKRNELAAAAAASAAAASGGTSSEVSKQQRSVSPFSEMSRRDEGDGRSIADSQSSSSYKATSIKRRHQMPVPLLRSRIHRS